MKSRIGRRRRDVSTHRERQPGHPFGLGDPGLGSVEMA
jgi:hypothetical protein